MAYKLFEANLPLATVTGLTANQYFWISRRQTNQVVSVGGAALVATPAVPAPTDQAIADLSLYQAVEMVIEHGALTSAVGGKVSVAEIHPELPQTDVPIAGSPRVVGGTTIDQALAATAESLRTSIISPYSGARLIKVALAILFTTVPTAGTGILIQLWGHQDGQQRQRG